jgi:hypothetical protein
VKLSYRLAMMFISLAIIVTIGWFSTQSFEFATGQFWFISGALLLIMLSLVDQPYFSKDANVFVNGATALVSLFTIVETQRTGLWWIFCSWSIYLIISSFVLMALRARELFAETATVRFVSRVNRAIGRPESIFSAYLLWGIFLQFTYPDDHVTINSLLLFWAVFMIVNAPGVSLLVSEYFDPAKIRIHSAGLITSILSPRIATVKLSASLPNDVLNKKVAIMLEGGEEIAEGILFEDCIVRGLRQGRIGLTSFSAKWSEISGGRRVEMVFFESADVAMRPVGVVSPGTSIGELVFEVDSRTPLHAGQVVQVKTGATVAYYQIVSAVIGQRALDEGNTLQTVKVIAGQLGNWDNTSATFAPIDWVAPAGELIGVSVGDVETFDVPDGHCVVGRVPNSRFPVHVNLSQAITHNMAIIGVTGSGKSYLAFHLIDAMVDRGVKVLILDISRQHDMHLTKHNPTALKAVGDVTSWLAGDSPIGIHQYGVDATGYPQITAEFVTAAFGELAKTRLERGKNIPAKLCVVFEEAHSLIPEWNQVAQKGDEHQVNKTARAILQGRKYGMGALIITQRTANVTKTILNQCNTVFALRSFDQTGLDFLRNYMGEAYSQAISTLPRFTAVLVGQASSSSRPIILEVSEFGEGAGEKERPPQTVSGTPAAA